MRYSAPSTGARSLSVRDTEAMPSAAMQTSSGSRSRTRNQRGVSGRRNRLSTFSPSRSAVAARSVNSSAPSAGNTANPRISRQTSQRPFRGASAASAQASSASATPSSFTCGTSFSLWQSLPPKNVSKAPTASAQMPGIMFA